MAGTTWNRALVTGASGGIGEAFARKVAAQGADLVLVARSGDTLERLAAELRDRNGVQCDVVPADLTTDLGVHAVEARVGDVDLLVNNAGYGISARLADVDPAHVEGMIRLNVLAVARLTRAALPRTSPARRAPTARRSSCGSRPMRSSTPASPASGGTR